MKREDIEKGSELLEEIKELSRYKSFLEDKSHGKVAHFEFIQHYGDAPTIIRFKLTEGIIPYLSD